MYLFGLHTTAATRLMSCHNVWTMWAKSSSLVRLNIKLLVHWTVLFTELFYSLNSRCSLIKLSFTTFAPSLLTDSASASYREVLVESPAEFEREFTAARAAQPTQLLVWVTAEWCPDCVQAKPVLTEHFKQLQNAVVLKCDVDRNTWVIALFGKYAKQWLINAHGRWRGNPDYPYRTHPHLKVQRIPTLIRFGKVRWLTRWHSWRLILLSAARTSWTIGGGWMLRPCLGGGLLCSAALMWPVNCSK